ncbi:MAG: DUF2892 domain-containing protein [Saprospiraceae bacterium]|nr:DUF2892 domain-containing protein [Saprospiraceae bacterium]
MQKNMGTIDRVVRLIVAAIVVFLIYNDTLTGTTGTVALILAAVFTLTSIVSFCPLYRLVGMSTCPVSTKKG